MGTFSERRVVVRGSAAVLGLVASVGCGGVSSQPCEPGHACSGGAGASGSSSAGGGSGGSDAGRPGMPLGDGGDGDPSAAGARATQAGGTGTTGGSGGAAAAGSGGEAGTGGYVVASGGSAGCHGTVRDDSGGASTNVGDSGGAPTSAAGGGADCDFDESATPTRGLVVSDNGIAFTSTPTLQHLTETVRITDPHGAPVAWFAQSNRSWLNVAHDANADSALVLEADPSLLAAETFDVATVSVAASQCGSVAETIRVGFWATEHTINERTKLTLNASSLATDPIRPYAYVAVGSDVAVYNVYSGAHLTTFSNVAPNVGDMVVSSDGARLFVIDTTNFAIVPVDLEQGSPGVSWPLGDAAPASVAYTRRRGQGLVITGNGSFFDATTGERFAARFSGGYYGYVVVSASRDGSRFCALDMGLSPYSMGCTALDFDAGASGVVLGSYVPAQSSGNWGVGSNGQDVAVTSDGSRAFVASGAPYDFRGYDTLTGSVLQALPGDAYPNNVEVTDQGLLVAGASVWYGDNDVWVYDAAGFLLASHKLSGYAQALRPRQLKASGDGLRLVALTDDPLLAFVTAVP